MRGSGTKTHLDDHATQLVVAAAKAALLNAETDNLPIWQLDMHLPRVIKGAREREVRVGCHVSPRGSGEEGMPRGHGSYEDCTGGKPVTRVTKGEWRGGHATWPREL